MVSARRARRLASLSVLFTTAGAQVNPNFTPSTRSTTTSSSTTSQGAASASSSSSSSSSIVASVSSSSTTPVRASFTTAVVPLYLYKAVESFLDDFPSTKPNYFTAFSWPSTLVVGTATYGMQTQAAITTTESSSEATATNESRHTSADSRQTTHQDQDKSLGIILGVVLGFVAVALMAGLFWFLARRKRKSGSFFMRRSSPSTSSKGSSRFRDLAMALHTAGKSPKVRSMSATEKDGPALLRPPLPRHQSSRSTMVDMPFYTPLESPADNTNQFGLHDQRAELARIIRGPSANQQTGISTQKPKRPPPFSPASLHQLRSQPSADRTRESDNIVSPISPTKSFERERTSIVHYPSMDEVNDFDFAGDGRRRASAGGRKGWHPARQRVEGRHEMA